MGKGIVYCHECGRSLREEEFEKSRAHWIDNVPYCLDCRTPDPTPPTGVHAKVKSKTATDRIPGARRNPRPHPGTPAKSPLPLILAVVGGALLLLILIVLAFKRGPGR